MNSRNARFARIPLVGLSNKMLFGGPVYSKWDTFPCATGARRMQSGKFFHGSILFADIDYLF